MSARIPDYHQAAGALHHEIPLLRFVNKTVFQTKAGSFGMVLQASGIDSERRLDEDLESYAAAGTGRTQLWMCVQVV
jgi:type IV secretory pathway VirB4 component